MSDLVGHPEDQFSHVAAQLIYLGVLFTQSAVVDCSYLMCCEFQVLVVVYI